MKKSYKLIGSEIIAKTDKATVVEVALRPSGFTTMSVSGIDGYDTYFGKGIAQRNPVDAQDDIVGKDLAECRAKNQALVDYKNDVADYIEFLQKELAGAQEVYLLAQNEIASNKAMIRDLVNGTYQKKN